MSRPAHPRTDGPAPLAGRTDPRTGADPEQTDAPRTDEVDLSGLDRNHRHPDHDRGQTSADKPDSPTDLTKPSWTYTLRKTGREFLADQCTDIAASLTYYAVLSLFPAIIALLSLVTLFGQGPQSVDALVQIVTQVAGASVGDTVRGPLESLSTASGGTLALVLGLLAALYSASNYTNAFGRAMNRMYSVPEGRPFWKLRPLMALVTLVMLVLVALVAIGLVVTGPAAQAVGDAIGLGDGAVLAWQIAKWPVMLAVVVLIIALLYWSAPNLEQPKFTWISVGAVLAIVVWALASAAFGFYVANFGSYQKTYGALAGVIIFLLWLWLTNLALLFGAELNSELERSRQLQAGIPAEEKVQLPLRDTRGADKRAEQFAEDVRRGRELRISHGRSDDPA